MLRSHFLLCLEMLKEGKGKVKDFWNYSNLKNRRNTKQQKSCIFEKSGILQPAFFKSQNDCNILSALNFARYSVCLCERNLSIVITIQLRNIR